MSFNEFIMNTLSEGKNPSSKRVAGCLGWAVCLAAAILGMFITIQSPGVLEMLFWSSSGLLGLDTVTNMFRGRYRNNGDIPDNQINC
mgnify:CR=1 FL=1